MACAFEDIQVHAVQICAGLCRTACASEDSDIQAASCSLLRGCLLSAARSPTFSPPQQNGSESAGPLAAPAHWQSPAWIQFVADISREPLLDLVQQANCVADLYASAERTQTWAVALLVLGLTSAGSAAEVTSETGLDCLLHALELHAEAVSGCISSDAAHDDSSDINLGVAARVQQLGCLLDCAALAVRACVDCTAGHELLEQQGIVDEVWQTQQAQAAEAILESLSALLHAAASLGVEASVPVLPETLHFCLALAPSQAVQAALPRILSAAGGSTDTLLPALIGETGIQALSAALKAGLMTDEPAQVQLWGWQALERLVTGLGELQSPF